MQNLLRQPATLLAAYSLIAPSIAQTWNSAHPAAPGYNTNYASAVAEQGGQNQIFQFGGIVGLTALDDVWRFHKTAGWTVLGNMPAGRLDCRATTVQDGGSDYVHLIGGRASATATTNNWRYDPASDTWDTSPAPMPAGRFNHEVVTAPNGYIYVFGGANSGGSAQDDVYRYDPVLDSWTTMPSMPQARRDYAAILDCDGYVFIYGGPNGATNHASVECFDTNTETWLATNPHTGGAIPDMPTPRSQLAGALGRNGKHYLIGGNFSSPVPVTTVQAFNPYTNGWTFEVGMAQSRNQFRAEGMGNRVWVLGGYRKNLSNTNKVESFGYLSLYSPCNDDVPALPGLVGGLSQANAALVHFHEGLVDIGIPPFQDQWFELLIPPTGPGVGFEIEMDAPVGSLIMTLYAGGQVVGQSDTGKLAADLSGLGGTSCYLQIREQSGQAGGVHYDLFATATDRAQPLGTTYCSPAVPNSTGLPSGIEAQGSPHAELNDVELRVGGLPSNTLGYFLTSPNSGSVQPAGSVGNLCVLNGIGRYSGNVLNSGQSGEVAMVVDLTDVPGNPSYAVQPGMTVHFTYWHRDQSATGFTSNFSDGVRIEF